LLYSIAYDNDGVVRNVRVADELFDRLAPDGLEFQSIEFSPLGVDPEKIPNGSLARDPRCDLVPEERQGNGIVADIVFNTPPGGGLLLAKDESLPSLMIDLEVETGDLVAPRTINLRWRDCLRGTGDAVTTALFMDDSEERGPAREDGRVQFTAGVDSETLAYGIDLDDMPNGGTVAGTPGSTLKVHGHVVILDGSSSLAG
jgi:hypothetical protein